jgi:hypothetical protein
MSVPTSGVFTFNGSSDYVQALRKHTNMIQVEMLQLKVMFLRTVLWSIQNYRIGK